MTQGNPSSWADRVRRDFGAHPAAIGGAALAAVLILVSGYLLLSGEDQGDASSAKNDKPAVQTTKKLMWGPTNLADGTPLWPVMKDLGVGIFGIQVRWEMVAPKSRPQDPTNPDDPAYEWPLYLAQSVNKAEKQGMEVQFMLMGAPPWANGGKSWEWIPDDPADFGDFATAVARKYPSVRHFMIWGEPNRQPNFQPLTPAPDATDPDDPLTPEQQVAPQNYAVLLEQAYRSLKAQNQRNLVIGGDTYTSAGTDNIRPWQWIRYMTLPDGGRPHMDMWGHNPWGQRRPNLDGEPSRNGTVSFNDLRELVKAIDEAGFPGGPQKLYLSEWGVPTGFEDPDLGYELDAETADKWIKAAFRAADWKRVYTLGWVHPADTDRNSTGLVTVDGEEKSDYDTYKKAE